MDQLDQAAEANANDNVERLVTSVMAVERQYGHALRGVQSDQLEEIRAAIEQMLGAGR